MKDFKELIIFEALFALIIAHAGLQSIGTVMQTQFIFYAILLALNLICLLWMQVQYDEEGILLDYNENLTPHSFIYILSAVIGIFFLSAVIVSAWTPSVIYVPTFALVVLDLGTLVTDILYNFALIAHSEETTKLVGHNAVWMYLKSRGWGDNRAKVLAIGGPIGFWASLHAYVAYVGTMMWPLVFVAFGAGLLLFWVIWQTKSLIAAITAHAFYNIIVLTAAGLGWVTLTVTPIALTIWAGVNLLLIVLTWRNRKSL